MKEMCHIHKFRDAFIQKMSKRIVMEARSGITYEIETMNCWATYTSKLATWEATIMLRIEANPDKAQAAYSACQSDELVSATPPFNPTHPNSWDVEKLLDYSGNRVYMINSMIPIENIPRGVFGEGKVTDHHRDYMSTMSPEQIADLFKGTPYRLDRAYEETRQEYERYAMAKRVELAVA